jgi:hypothetical protein
VSEHQPRPRDGWPAQPPADGAGQGGYGEADYGSGPGSYDQATYGQQAAPPRRRRRKRWPIVLVVLVVLILAILGIGDQVAKSVAQNDIANQIQSSGLSTKPSVNIEGWPFLTQIAAHDVKTIDISANNVTASGSKVAFNFTAKATGVHLNSSFNGATIDNINGQAVLPFSSVASLLPVSGATLTADPAKGPNAIKADLGIAGSVTGTVKESGTSAILVSLDSASGLASILGSASGQSFTIPIPKLPAGLVVRSVRVNSQGVVANASATNTTLSQ